MSSAMMRRAIAEARAAQLLQTPAPGPCGCQHHHQAPAPAPIPVRGSVARPLAVAGGVIVGGIVLTAMFLAVALTAVAVGVSSVVLLLLVREVRKGGVR